MQGPMVPGTACLDAPVQDANGKAGWLLDHLGDEFMVLSFGTRAETDLPQVVVASQAIAGVDTVVDHTGTLTQRYSGRDGTAYLIRPDQHVAARFAKPTPDSIARALARATGREAA
jgi:3-(3-hydroxy-phenyl)propionate hydroxylase